MALIGCPSCSRKISTEAVSCPKCGHPLEEGWVEEKEIVDAKEKKKKPGCWTFLLITMGITSALVYFNPDGSNKSYKEKSGITFSAAQYGDQWGFKVNSLIARCTRDHAGGNRRPHVTVEAQGREYALNGAAMGSGLYPSAHEIMLRDKKYDLFLFKGPDDVLSRTLALCE